MSASPSDAAAGSPHHLWQEAAAFAARQHRNQVRKDGRTPYVSHVFRVTLTLTQVYGCTDNEAIAAALLHDTIEDTTTDYEDISDRFGSAVAEIVAALTKNMALPEAEREAEYDARLAKADWRARLIKLADVYDNLFDLANHQEGVSKRAKAIEHCQRAVHLSRADTQPEILRAREIVSGLVQRETKR